MAVRGLMQVWNAVAVVAVTAVAYGVAKLLWKWVGKPLRLRRIMAKQGVRGPPFRLLVGQVPEMAAFANSFPQALPLDNYANFSPTVAPQHALYCPKYGKSFVYSAGSLTRFVVRDPEIVKELLVTNHGSLKRPPIEYLTLTQIMGRGMAVLVGEKWAVERRTLGPFFHQDALKAMVEAMVEGSKIEVQSWEQVVVQAGGSVEVDVEPDIHKISGRILSYTAFGGDFEKGEQIYTRQTKLLKELYATIRSTAFWVVPGYRKLPTERNRLMNQYASEINTLLHEVINSRRDLVQNGEASSYGNDLLGRMLASASGGWDEKTHEFNLASVFNNCKLFYFAGQDTVANATGFSMLMLAKHPAWQDRARKEVLEVIGNDKNYDASALSRLKVVGMIFNETLRIFPPAPAVSRTTVKDLQVKDLLIPKGLIMEFAIAAMHQDKDYWGEDVGEFNPERFANGVSGACTHPQAFMPFGLGPKFCIGNNFAIMEAKIILSMVLRRFQLLPSPNYKHHPTFAMVQRPKHGLPIILKAL